jgi:hypothetical protein
MRDEEISQTEVDNAINDAHKDSTPGPSGQKITHFKLPF